MHIWVDADACPGVIKEIIYRAAERRQIQTTLVANQMLRTPPSRSSAPSRWRTALTSPMHTSSIR
jgi:uncharacterized protein YaiI (UPF0178 family)